MSEPFARILKRSLKLIGIFVLSFFCIGILIGLFYSAEVKKMMIDQLNKNLETEIDVKDFSFSILRHFPYASFDMKHITAKEVIDNSEKDTLLYADHLSLLFNLTAVFNKNFAVKKIVITDGKVKVKVDANGKNNYHFWKSSANSDSSAAIDLQKIILNNISISYVNIHDRQDYLLTAKKGELSGKFASDDFLLKTKSDLFVHHLKVHGVNYISEKEFD